MAEKILITGATGLIGSEFVRLCHENDIAVNYLTTSKEKIKNEPNYQGFYWNPLKGEIDIKAFEDVTAIVNLVGSPIAKRWTKKYKQTIFDSRIGCMDLLYNTLDSIDHNIGYFISASGISIYPESKTKLYTEEDFETADTFLGNVVVAWEEAANKFKNLGMDVAIVRTGMVLAKEGGALPQLITPIKLGVGAAMGNGKQWQSWIHVKDVAGIYLFLLKNNLDGIYNAVSADPVRNRKMTRLIASKLNKPLWLPKVPGIGLRIILGEMADLVLEGQLVSPKKIKELGYSFEFYNIEMALQDLL